MTPVTISTAVQRGAWKVDPLTQTLLRPMRLRPSRPIHTELAHESVGKRKKRRKLLLRPRVRKIDTSLWGNIHLREGDFSQAVIYPAATEKATKVEPTKPKYVGSVKKRNEEMEVERKSKAASTSQIFSENNNVTPEATGTAPIGGHGNLVIDMSVSEEKTRSLILLQSMFKNSEDWGGREAIDSDDEGVITADIEKRRTADIVHSGELDNADLPTIAPIQLEEEKQESHEKVHEKVQYPDISNILQSGKPSLKDMFKPQVEEGG